MQPRIRRCLTARTGWREATDEEYKADADWRLRKAGVEIPDDSLWDSRLHHYSNGPDPEGLDIAGRIPITANIDKMWVRDLTVMDDIAYGVLESVASSLWEPADWAFTINDIRKNGVHWYHAGILLPVLSSSELRQFSRGARAIAEFSEDAATEARVVGRAEREASRSYDDLVEAARERYPNKAGKIEKHHVTPKYMGGDPKGSTVPLDAAYHQMITNEFRRLHPYGAEPPSPEQVQQIMEQVYQQFPLPGH
jgi:hypothetical protein